MRSAECARVRGRARAHMTRTAATFAAVRMAGCALGGVALLIAACGGGGHTGASRVSYCRAFAKDWPALLAASRKAADANASFQDPVSDPAAVRKELVDDRSTYMAAAGLASTLARSAPSKLKNDIPADTANPRQRLLALSSSLTGLAAGDTQQLGTVDVTAFDAGGTGCNFTTGGGPNGTVATEFWP